MVHKILFWTGFGVAVRFWQLGIQMIPFFGRHHLWGYPIYGAVGGSFGYWMTRVERRQVAVLAERKNILLEKRARREQREAAAAAAAGDSDKVAGVGSTAAVATME